MEQKKIYTEEEAREIIKEWGASLRDLCGRDNTLSITARKIEADVESGYAIMMSFNSERVREAFLETYSSLPPESTLHKRMPGIPIQTELKTPRPN